MQYVTLKEYQIAVGKCKRQGPRTLYVYDRRNGFIGVLGSGNLQFGLWVRN